MLRFAFRGGLSLLFTVFVLFSFAQYKLPNTLLWRISGHGLQKPSYLFGTMHLPDKRLFLFGDSLYHALETTEGFAMEIDAREMMDSLITMMGRRGDDDNLQKQSVKLNRRKLSKSADSLLRSAGIRGETATKKDLKKIRDRRMTRLFQQGEMPTIVDAYLLGLAMRLNKWTGGIEDVSDQLDLSDELGGALEPEAVLQDDAAFKRYLEEMIGVYVAQDLEQILTISNRAYEGEDRDLMLTKRNVKMTYRMDSLSRLRSTFFAVGAAHLPGDSGVIALLKKEGFAVEPVFSSAKIPADAYAAKLAQVPWATVEDEAKTFVVQMPGTPTLYPVEDKTFKPKFYFDMTTLTFYMAGSVSGPEASVGKLNELMMQAVQGVTGKKAPVKTTAVQSNGLSGLEAFAENGEGSYRLRYFVKGKTLFMLMTGAPKKAQMRSADADRFFASFVPGQAFLPAVWQRFSLPEKGFSVTVPATLQANPEIDRKVEESSVFRSKAYTGTTPGDGSFYFVQTVEAKPDQYIESDSVYFASLKESYNERFSVVSKAQTGMYKGYPALWVDASSKEPNAVYRMLHVLRGNRAYALMYGAEKGQEDSAADRFLQSLNLLPYEAVTYQTQAADGFSAPAPAAFQKMPPDSAETSPFYSAGYVSYNAKEAVSYQTYVRQFSPVFWADSDSAFWEGRVELYKAEGDSVLKKAGVQNGGVRGIEFWLQAPNGVKCLRELVAGDTLYTLSAVLPLAEVNDSRHRNFFDSFRIAHQTPPVIYTRKPAALLQGLLTTDSALFANALQHLDGATFEKQDLPLLHRALLQTYRDSEDGSVTGRLVRRVTNLADSSTVRFVESEYPLLKPEQETLRYDLLALLAQIKTAESYAVLKTLLGRPLPTDGDASGLKYALYDSLALTATLFPDLLRYSTDSLLGHAVVTVADRLLDSNRLSRQAVQLYAKPLLQSATQAFGHVKRGDKEAWELVYWMQPLACLNAPESKALLRQALLNKDLYLKRYAALALLKSGAAVSPLELTKIAADKTHRNGFYGDLKTINRTDLFPAAYASQRSLAESELYNIFDEEYADVSLTCVGERVAEYAGKQSRFLLFKLRMVYDEDRKRSFLAVAGPYAVDGKETLPTTGASGFYEDEEFDATRLAAQLKAYLTQMEPAKK